MIDLVLRPIDAEGFAPFGVLLDPPDPDGETVPFAADIENRRPHARLNVSLTRAPASPLPATLAAMEIHRHSSQAFVPRAPCAFTVVVAPQTAAQTPDLERVRAFVSRQGVVYRPDVWHHPFLSVGGPSDCLMLRWDDGGDADTEWHTLETAIRLRPPA